MVLDVENGFRDHGEIAFEKQVIDADDGTGKRVFHGSKENVRCAIRDGGEGGIESWARNSRDGIAEKLEGGGGTLQLQIKERRTKSEVDLVYQVLFPKDRKGEAVLLRRSGSRTFSRVNGALAS